MNAIREVSATDLEIPSRFNLTTALIDAQVERGHEVLREGEAGTLLADAVAHRDAYVLVLHLRVARPVAVANQ